MEEFPSNSRTPKDEPATPKKVTRVTQGDVVRRKKPLGKRFSEMFIGGDAPSVGSYVMFDVLLPAIKDMIADAMSMGVEKMLYGETRPAGRSSSYRPGGFSGGHTPYNRMSTPGHRPDPREPMSRRAKATHDFDEIILRTRVEAQEVIDGLFDLILKYQQATVADLYDLVGETPAYTDDKYGWTDIRDADIRRVREGYLIKLPQPEPLR